MSIQILSLILLPRGSPVHGNTVPIQILSLILLLRGSVHGNTVSIQILSLILLPPPRISCTRKHGVNTDLVTDVTDRADQLVWISIIQLISSMTR